MFGWLFGRKPKVIYVETEGPPAPVPTDPAAAERRQKRLAVLAERQAKQRRVQRAVIAKLEKRLADPSWSAKHEHYAARLAELEAMTRVQTGSN